MDILIHSNKLSKLFSEAEKIVLICHINPDGDAIGSMLALYYYLLSKGKNVEMVSPNYMQDFLLWMEGTDKINVFLRRRKKCKKQVEEADLIVMVDFNQTDRLGEIEGEVMRSKAYKVVIDHHVNPSQWADYLISLPSRCATAEIIHDLVTTMEGKAFDNISYVEAVYVGIITDTGSFDFGSYDGHTLRVVAELLDYGVDKEKIRLKIYNNFSSDRMRLMGFALDQRMVIFKEYSTAYIFLSNDDLQKYNHIKGDTEGFVNLPLEIKDIEFSVLFMEKTDLIKLSFRSKNNFPVNEFAEKYFGGGGHKNAAGGEFKGSLSNAIETFTKIVAIDNPVLKDKEEK